MRTSSVIQPVFLGALVFGAQRVLAGDERYGLFVSLHN